MRPAYYLVLVGSLFAFAALVTYPVDGSIYGTSFLCGAPAFGVDVDIAGGEEAVATSDPNYTGDGFYDEDGDGAYDAPDPIALQLEQGCEVELRYRWLLALGVGIFGFVFGGAPLVASWAVDFTRRRSGPPTA